jgi:hypothetical protein
VIFHAVTALKCGRLLGFWSSPPNGRKMPDMPGRLAARCGSVALPSS